MARMGKKRLRPGGKRATEWLLERGRLGPETRVFEAACNMGTTAIELARRFGCAVTACDLDEEALRKAAVNVRKAGLEGRVTLHHADATNLPFAGDAFDVVINEAMLTMLPPDKKKAAVAEYCRVLRPGGVLLTHDVELMAASSKEQSLIRQELSRAINVPVQPLSEEDWQALFRDAGFGPVEVLRGKMTLMSVQGMLYDEGPFNAVKVVANGIRPANRKMFLGMRDVFMRRRNQLGFIAVASTKSV